MKKQLNQYNVDNEDELTDNESYLQTDQFINTNESNIPTFAKGGNVHSLFKMAGGGHVLYSTPWISDPDAGPLTEAKAQHESRAPKNSETNLGDVDWLQADLYQGQAKLDAANQVFAGTLWKYGGKAELAQNDAAVKQAYANATPNVWESALKKNRKDYTTKQRDYLFDAKDPRDQEWDYDEMRSWQKQNGGKLEVIKAGESFWNYAHNIPMEQIGAKGVQGIGSSWADPNKSVAKASDVMNELETITSRAFNTQDEKQTVSQRLQHFASQIDDQVLQGLVTTTNDRSSNERAIRLAADRIDDKLSGQAQKAMQMMYLKTHRDKDGNIIDNINPETGEYTEDYLKWKNNFLTEMVESKIYHKDKPSVSFSNAEWKEGWNAGENRIIDKTDPMKDIVKHQKIGGGWNQKAIATPKYNEKGEQIGMENIKADIWHYPMLQTLKDKMNNRIGSKLGDNQETRIVMNPDGTRHKWNTANGQGVIVGYDPEVSKYARATTGPDGNIIHVPDAQWDPNYIDPATGQRGGYRGIDDPRALGNHVKVKVAVSQKYLYDNADTLGTWADMNGTGKLVWVPYSLKAATERAQREHWDKMPTSGSTYFSNITKEAEELGAQDISNEELKSMKTADGRKFEDEHAELFDTDYGFIDNDVVIIPQIMDLSDGEVLEKRPEQTKWDVPGGSKSNVPAIVESMFNYFQ
jgi:hypothetical protein